MIGDEKPTPGTSAFQPMLVAWSQVCGRVRSSLTANRDRPRQPGQFSAWAIVKRRQIIVGGRIIASRATRLNFEVARGAAEITRTVLPPLCRGRLRSRRTDASLLRTPSEG